MSVSKYLSLSYIDGWCAGCKVSGINNASLSCKDFPSLDKIITAVAEEFERSCIVVSTNVEETAANNWLIDNGFVKGPDILNWNHGGRITNLWFYQRLVIRPP